MTIPLHSQIKRRREQLGIGLAELARRIGVETSMYWDVELYDDELRLVLPLRNVRALATILGFDLGTLLGLGSLAGLPNANKARHIVLGEARTKLGVSAKQFVDDIGFDETFVRSIETDGRALEAYPYELLRMIAEYLKLDPVDVLCAPFT